MCAVLVVLGVLGSRSYNRAWENEKSLFAAAVEHPYGGHIAYSGMSRALYVEGEYAEALKYAERSIELRPTMVNLGRKADCLLRLKSYEEAIEPLSILLRNREEASTLRKLLTCYVELGREEEAREALARYPELAESAALRGMRERLRDK